MWRYPLLLGGVLACVFVVWHTRDDEPRTLRSVSMPVAPAPASPVVAARVDGPSPATDDAPEPSAVTTALHEISVANGDPSETGTLALVERLKSDDMVVVAEAADGLVARSATSAIFALAEIDIRRADGIAPSIISALGRLGGMADGDMRQTAVTRLIALLDAEKRRGTPDTAGNLLQIYEALGETRDSRAARPLEAELTDDSVGMAPKVVIVQALALIGSASSRPVVTRARAGALAIVPADAFEVSLRSDLVQAIDVALAALP